MEESKLQLAYGQVPKVLLLGNGINRAYGFASWDEMIESIRTKDLSDREKECVKNIPYPLQPVILTSDHLGMQMEIISEQLSLLNAGTEENEMLRTFASLPVDTILTANYTYELEKALNSSFTCLPGRRCSFRKSAYTEGGKYNTEQLHTYFDVNKYPPIWHIHGEAARHNTMVWGHYYYGKLLAKMQQYISSLLSCYNARAAKGQSMNLRSWLDYFMLGDVHIVGLGMALSEIDLWWLVNCKKRHFPDRQVILYKPDMKPEEKLLAEAYSVTVNTDGFTGDYKAYYSWLCTELERIL
ncbi:MAG: hypothetical protein J6S71_00365 [Clostridia bacterium]|nr:hypothetical protein [Clostridia bacterium]